MDASSIRLLEDNAGRRQTEVTLVAALILLIVLIASLARSCPPLPSVVSPSSVPYARSLAHAAPPAAHRSSSASTGALPHQNPEPGPSGE
jgi:hypothetical protein